MTNEKYVKETTKKEYSIKPRDFIPAVGSLFYCLRNYEKVINNAKIIDGDIKTFIATGFGLSILDFATGYSIAFTIASKLESLIK